MSIRSYFWPRLIYKHSAKGNVIEVIERYGKRCLMINGHPQTNPEYRSNWHKLLARNYNLLSRENLKVLILGLGGGDAICAISERLPTSTITAIEIDQNVIEVASNYFGIHDTATTRIICADAKHYLSQTKENYDLVIVDLYDGDDIPDFVQSDKFIREVAETTNRDGVAIFNYASHKFRVGDFGDFQKLLNKYYTSVLLNKYWGHTYYVTHN